ncbi:MAG: DUF502 domain-containing protein [Bacteroidota bacterium]|nr:DUF502 domain-containing protein [Bacteroidota bacterium]|tara:strand:- start:66 stop:656 length:591 start_codon:yes stop_codon:yes gene_type:complete
MKKLLRYFLQGILYIVPLFVTIYIVYWAFRKIGGILGDYLPNENEFFGLALVNDIIGLIIIIAIITLIGYIGSTIIGSPINTFFKRMLEKAPLLKTIYTSVKDLMNTFVGNKKGFKKAVFVKLFDNSNIERIGFISNEDLKSLNIHEGRVLVYIPHSYNFSGNLFVVEKKYITPIDAPSSEIMKLIVSGGVTNLEN